MPLHLNALTNHHQDELLAYLLQNGLDHAEDAIAGEDGRILHLANPVWDAASGERIGKFVFTLLIDDARKALEAIDIDITLDSAETAELRFLEKLPQSSDANEYYDVETANDRIRLQIETVNRNFLAGDIVDTVQRVRACAFPFQLTVYDDMDALNDAVGLKQTVNVNGTDMTVGGLSSIFAAPGSLGSIDGSESDIYSLMVGIVRNIRDVSVKFGEKTLTFVIVQLESALGLLPVAMGRDVFDLDKLAPGRAIMMNADVKADFAVDQ